MDSKGEIHKPDTSTTEGKQSTVIPVRPFSKEAIDYLNQVPKGEYLIVAMILNQTVHFLSSGFSRKRSSEAGISGNKILFS